MRMFGCSLIGMLVIALVVHAQGAGQPPPPENLDTVLLGWEKAMTDLRSFALEIERSTHDKALNTRDSYKGIAMFMKAPSKQDTCRARLELNKVGNPNVFEKFICTGTYLYEFSPTDKKIRVHDMPQNKQGAGQESFLTFLFGMGAEQAKARYSMEYKGGDKYYHYIRVLPKQKHDISDFSEARLSLFRNNHLPAQIWYLQPNGNQITWNFSKVQIDVQIPVTYFQADAPNGWTTERVPQRIPANVTPTFRNKP